MGIIGCLLPFVNTTRGTGELEWTRGPRALNKKEPQNSRFYKMPSVDLFCFVRCLLKSVDPLDRMACKTCYNGLFSSLYSLLIHLENLFSFSNLFNSIRLFVITHIPIRKHTIIIFMYRILNHICIR